MKSTLLLTATLVAGLTQTIAVANASGWWYSAYSDGTSSISWPLACANATQRLLSRYPNAINISTRTTEYDTYNMQYHCTARGQYQK